MNASKISPPLPRATTGTSAREAERFEKTIDCFIATFCIQQNHALLHNHRDFDAFEELLDLQVVHP